jgi:hypothetical protein
MTMPGSEYVCRFIIFDGICRQDCETAAAELLAPDGFCLNRPTANSAPSWWIERTHADWANAMLAYHWEHGSGHQWAHGNIVANEEPARNKGVLSSRGDNEVYSVIRQAQVQTARRRQQGDFVAAYGYRQHDRTAMPFLGVETEIEREPIQRHLVTPGQLDRIQRFAGEHPDRP